MKVTVRRVAEAMAADGLAERTVAERTRVVRALERSAGKKARHVTPADARAWWASTASLAPASRRQYLAHVRAWYAAAGVADPTAGIRRPRMPNYLPRPISERDLEVVLDLIGGDVGVWVALMGVCGLRCVEVARMAPGDVTVDGEHRALRVRGKGNRLRMVPLPEEVDRRLAGYSWPDGLVPANVSKIVARALRGVGVEATAHQLRHTAATRFYRASGGDVLATARFLGHANVGTTMRYAEVDLADAERVLERLAAGA